MLELRGLVKRYGPITALDGMECTIAPGEIFGLVGANGAGKTTAMRMIIGLVVPDEGSMSWMEQPIDAVARKGFGYMPEELGLYPKMTAHEQLRYFGELRGLPRATADDAAGYWIERLRLESRRHERVDRLSLGNQQRLQLAVALVHRPDLMILDEPFSGLDPQGADEIVRILREEADRGATIIFSSHQLEFVEDLCERVVILSRGRTAAAGRVADLRRAHSRRLMRVDFDPLPDGWQPRLAGVEVVERVDGAGVVLQLDDDVNEQDVLSEARQAGDVQLFGWLQPTLKDVFKDVVD
jgi:ABC-2 type transport system ATP-binding protein